MITPTKITLSAQELQLVTNSEWILTKRAITDKVYGLLGALSERMKELLQKEKEWLPLQVTGSDPKIYKGENYRLLPYVMLDMPRCFNGTDVFAIRSMFWWGNFFSITLQLSGDYKKMFGEALINNIQLLQKGDYYICVNEDPWQHHFGSDNYILSAACEKHVLQSIIEEKPFIKLALQFSLQQWEAIPELLEKSFVETLQLLKA